MYIKKLNDTITCCVNTYFRKGIIDLNEYSRIADKFKPLFAKVRGARTYFAPLNSNYIPLDISEARDNYIIDHQPEDRRYFSGVSTRRYDGFINLKELSVVGCTNALKLGMVTAYLNPNEVIPVIDAEGNVLFRIFYYKGTNKYFTNIKPVYRQKVEGMLA